VPVIVLFRRTEKGKLDSIVVKVSCCCKNSKAASSFICWSTDTVGVAVQTVAVTLDDVDVVIEALVIELVDRLEVEDDREDGEDCSIEDEEVEDSGIDVVEVEG
jgi:hypothetical protein